MCLYLSLSFQLLHQQTIKMFFPTCNASLVCFPHIFSPIVDATISLIYLDACVFPHWICGSILSHVLVQTSTFSILQVAIFMILFLSLTYQITAYKKAANQQNNGRKICQRRRGILQCMINASICGMHNAGCPYSFSHNMLLYRSNYYRLLNLICCSVFFLCRPSIHPPFLTVNQRMKWTTYVDSRSVYVYIVFWSHPQNLKQPLYLECNSMIFMCV